jgi:hypothetical protein
MEMTYIYTDSLVGFMGNSWGIHGEFSDHTIEIHEGPITIHEDP